MCCIECDNLSRFISHLNKHLKEGTVIICPFAKCSREFKLCSSFSFQLSQNHRNFTVNEVEEMYISSRLDLPNILNEVGENVNNTNDESLSLSSCDESDDVDNALSSDV